MKTMIKSKLSQLASIALIRYKSPYRSFIVGLIKRIYKKKQSYNELGAFVGYLSYKNASVKYFLNKDSFIENKILKDGIHSKYVLDEIMSNIIPDSIFIDVGANIGSISLPVATICKNTNVSVVSCESSSVIFKKLEKNILLNDINNVHPYECAVYSHNDGVVFHEQLADAKNQGLSSINQNEDIGEYVEKHVESITLDSLINSLNLNKRVSVVKIDVQGSEYQVLLGAKEVIEKDRPVVIFEHEDEYHNEPENVKHEIVSFFDAHGYSLFVLNPSTGSARFALNMKDYVNTNIVAFPIRP